MSNATNGFRTDSYWGPRLKVLCSRHGMKILELNNGQFYEVDLINNLGHVLNPIPRFPVKFRCAIFTKSTRPKNPSPNPKIFSVEDSHQFTLSHFHNFTTLSQLLRFFWGISQCWAENLKITNDVPSSKENSSNIALELLICYNNIPSTLNTHLIIYCLIDL